MHKITSHNISLWQFDNLSQHARINHFVSDRHGLRPHEEFTLSLSSTPNKTLVLENRRQLASAMGLSEQKLYFPSQVHKTNIVNVTSATNVSDVRETDALITNKNGLCIAVMSADCVPILLYDKRNNAIAAVHSGWRGTVAKILEKTLIRMSVEFGTEGKDIVAGIGPSVSKASYEVGEEVINEFLNAFENGDRFMTRYHDKAKLDLWMANKDQLISFGVPEDKIEVSNLCTVKNNADFFSARKGDAGRFAAGIMLK
jgi:YfiH family protein